MPDSVVTEKTARSEVPVPEETSVPEVQGIPVQEAGHRPPEVAPLPFLDDLRAGLPEGYSYSELRQTIFARSGSVFMVLCGPIHLRRDIRAADSGTWYAEIEFADRDLRPRRLIVPVQDLHVQPARLAARLVDLGFVLHAAPARLAAMLRQWDRCHAGACGTWRTGWHGSPNEVPDFVLASGRTIPDRPEGAPNRQTAEIQIRIAIMNRCSALGRAEIEAIA